MKKQILRSITPLLCSLFLFSCSTRFDVGTDFDESYDFSGFRTFALVTPENIDSMADDLMQERVEMAINAQFAARGFVNTTPDQADMVISYFTTTQEGTDIQVYQSYNNYYRYNSCYRCGGIYARGLPATEVRTVEYTQGVLMIDIVDPGTSTLKWRGQTSARFSAREAATMSAPERTELINSAVLAILNNFPPGYEPIE
jgi:hypothetical protein